MALLTTLKNKFIGKALQQCADPFEEGRIIVLLNFSLFMLITNIPYVIITFDAIFSNNSEIYHFISAVIQDGTLIAVIFLLNRGYKLKLARALFFANFLLQNLYHNFINNGTMEIMAQGVLFFTMIVLFAFFLFGNVLGWCTFLVMSGIIVLDIYNEQHGFSVFKFPAYLADPVADNGMKYLIALPLAMNVYLVSEFVKSQNKAKRQIFVQNKLLAEKNKEILDSITYAKKIQEAILPSLSNFRSFFQNSFIFYRPKDIVAGDFYFLETTGNKVVCAVADCTGHGVPGALMSVACSNSLKRAVKEFKMEDSGSILDKTRDLVIESLSGSETGIKDGMDISLFVLDPQKKQMTWSGANNPLLIIRNNQLLEYKPDKQPVGTHINHKAFTTHQINLQADDKMYIFSDGFQDQFGGDKGKKYSVKRLKAKLQAISTHTMEKQGILLEKGFEDWKKEHDQLDDVCVMGIELKNY